MKILYHHRTQWEEPECVHIKAVVDSLRRLGHDVLLVGPQSKVPETSGKGALSKIKRMVPSCLFEVLQIFYNAISILKLWRAIAQFKPDLIYERYALYSFAGVAVSRVRAVPIILEVNTPYAHAWAKYYRVYWPRLAIWFERHILRGASHVVTVTAVQKDFLTEHYLDKDRITVCHNAIDPDEFNCDMIPIISGADWDESCVVVGFVGTMNRWQGIPVFKTVMPEVIRCNPKVRFLMVGDGEYKQELQDHLIQSGCDDRVEFTGRRPHADIPGYIARMDITVLPDSNSYGSPMKIFEYMAMGKAIVAPRVAPVQEIMEDGTTGFVIPPGDAEAMIERILFLATDESLRKKLGSAARDYVLASHTWEANAKVIVHLADKLGVRETVLTVGITK